MLTNKNSIVNLNFSEVNNHSYGGLHPEHLADLRKSGLSDESILRSGVYSVRPSDINRILGTSLSSRVSSLLAFPYPGNGFTRYKLFPSFIDREGHKQKYFQPKGSGVHLYIPPGAEETLFDPSIPLTLTEGEKKALKASQEGVSCIGLAGVWNWKNKDDDNLIPDFDLINLCSREIWLVPDSDFGTNESIQLAIYRLAERLMERGAIVYLIHLPDGNEEKAGLDDYLLTHSREEFQTLPKIQITPEMVEWVKEPSIEGLSSLFQESNEATPLEIKKTEYPYKTECGRSTLIITTKNSRKSKLTRTLCHRWDCPYCSKLNKKKWIGKIRLLFSEGGYCSAIESRERKAWLKAANRVGARGYIIYQGTTKTLLFVANISVKDLPFISGDEFNNLIESYLGREEEPMNGGDKITSFGFKGVPKKNIRKDSKGENEVDEVIVAIVPVNIAEAMRRIFEKGGELIEEREGSKEDDDSLTVNLPECIHSAIVSQAEGRIYPVFEADDPFAHLKIVKRLKR